jgi:uncharacterized membrane protein YqaE (UPF0057 family)
MSHSLKALGILATVLIPPAGVYFAVQEIGPLSYEAKELARILTMIVGAGLLFAVYVAITNPRSPS